MNICLSLDRQEGYLRFYNTFLSFGLLLVNACIVYVCKKRQFSSQLNYIRLSCLGPNSEWIYVYPSTGRRDIYDAWYLWNSLRAAMHGMIMRAGGRNHDNPHIFCPKLARCIPFSFNFLSPSLFFVFNHVYMGLGLFCHGGLLWNSLRAGASG